MNTRTRVVALLILIMLACLVGCSCAHIFTEWENGEGAKQYRVCSECGETEWRTSISETMAPTGETECNHIYSDWESGQGDKQYRICSKCGDTEWQSVVLDTVVSTPIRDTEEEAAENRLIGDWTAAVLMIDGEVITDSFICSRITAEVNDDYTGRFLLDGEWYDFEWDYYKTEDGIIYYRMIMGEDLRKIGIITEIGNEFYGLLVIYLKDGYMICMDKD